VRHLADEKCKTDYPNRIEVFQHLTYDEITQSLNMNKFDSILDKYYDDFVEFCDKIKEKATKLTSISCYIEDDKIHFVIEE
jgi:hypothetical protein